MQTNSTVWIQVHEYALYPGETCKSDKSELWKLCILNKCSSYSVTYNSSKQLKDYLVKRESFIVQQYLFKETVP